MFLYGIDAPPEDFRGTLLNCAGVIVGITEVSINWVGDGTGSGSGKIVGGIGIGVVGEVG